ncbi:MAG: AraC family transcriptional regulator ligand-binding domain-containing protein [Rhodocyclales bacterium]|nr:AraC family transcriptional regulator ligand-binding domain-containing protein [Rhodocyclales bacterium]
MSSETFLATFGLIGLRLVERHGIDPQRFARELGFASTAIPDAKTRLPSELGDIGFEKAMALIPEPAFALRAAECWHPSHLGTLGYAWLSSGSLRTALKRLERYSHLLGQKASCKCGDTAEGLCFSFDTGRGDAPVGHAVADFALSLILSMCRTNLGAPLAPLSAGLRRPLPANRQPYEISSAAGSPSAPRRTASSWRATSRTSRCRPPTWSWPEPSMPSSPTSWRSCRTTAWKPLQGLFPAEAHHSGGPTEEGPQPGALAMSRRTLQKAAGKRPDLPGACWKKAAPRPGAALLDDPDKTVTDITFLLGFSEQSAFTRAFKRWHGKSPSAYREQSARA